MAPYRLCLFDQDGRLLAPALVVRARNDAEAIARAETLRGSLAAEVLDFDSLRIIRYLVGGEASARRSGTRPTF
jgi:hypothetical protein